VIQLSAQGPTRRDVGFFALALLALVGLVLVLGDTGILLTRPLWVDEWLAVMVASRPSPASVIGDLGSGADGGASAFHLGLWLLRNVVGSLTPPVLRLVSLGCVLTALLLSYVILRRRFPVPASAAGALAAGANALLIEHSYEARFYGPWLLCCALCAWLLARRQGAGATRASGIALGAAAFVLCTIHFYGIITLALLCAGAVAAHGRRWRAPETLRLIAPAATGLAALAVVIPLAIAQRVAYTVPSWLPDFQWSQLAALLSDFWLATIPLFAALAIVIGIVVRSRADDGRAVSDAVRGVASDAGIAALASLALMPLALAFLSLMGQPSMLPRYAIAAALAWAPWVGLAALVAGRWITRAMLAILAWFWVVGYVKEARLKSDYALAVGQATAAFEQARRAGGALPIVFPSIHVMYPVVLGAPALPGSPGNPRFLEIPDATFRALFPDSTPLGQMNRVVVLERDLARVHARRFGFPVLAPAQSLDSLRQFLLLSPEGRLPAGFRSVEHFAATLFPQHRFRRLLPDLGMLERATADSSSK
jgi:hypothetical protein